VLAVTATLSRALGRLFCLTDGSELFQLEGLLAVHSLALSRLTDTGQDFVLDACQPGHLPMSALHCSLADDHQELKINWHFGIPTGKLVTSMAPGSHPPVLAGSCST